MRKNLDGCESTPEYHRRGHVSAHAEGVVVVMYNITFKLELPMKTAPSGVRLLFVWLTVLPLIVVPCGCGGGTSSAPPPPTPAAPGIPA